MDATAAAGMAGVYMVEDMEYMVVTDTGRVDTVKEVGNENVW